jgi:hypothetical protein
MADLMRKLMTLEDDISNLIEKRNDKDDEESDETEAMDSKYD